MFPEIFTLLSVLLVSLTSLGMLISRNWRLSIVLLALQFLGVFILVWMRWPVELAVVKLVAGWMCGAVLGTGMLNSPQSWEIEEHFWPSGRFFRLLAAILVGLAGLSIAPKVADWIPGISNEQSWGAVILVCMGLLQLGLTDQPLRVILGLLTVLSGFEILYAVVETSTLVAGLLAGVNLALALTGAYMFNSPMMDEA